jgi:putative oxidoreductase
VTIAEAVARPLLAGVFIVSGIDTLRNAGKKADVADSVLEPLERATGLEGPVIVKVNAGAQVVAGACLALGILPRPAAVVLAASLVPTTLAGHRPWDEDDPTSRAMQTTQLLKNVAVLGGLVFAATSTGGRPSLPWRARRAARRVAETSAGTIEHLRHLG